MSSTSKLSFRAGILDRYNDVLGPDVVGLLEALAPLDAERKALMKARTERRAARIAGKTRITFLDPASTIARTDLTVADARAGKFEGAPIPKDLERQWIQGTGPATKPRSSVASGLRNVAYALLSGADGWMFDGEDALGQVETMSLDNQRNLKLAFAKDPQFLAVANEVAVEMNAWAKGFLNKTIVEDVQKQLDFTTRIFRARGLHLDDRQIRHADGAGLSASIVDAAIYVANNHATLRGQARSLVLYLPKIQTAEEASFWNHLLSTLEEKLALPASCIRTYVLIEQLEASFQLMEIRAALGKRFAGFNTGRWDYINSVADALAWDPAHLDPNIDAITMTYGYMRNYEDRVRRAVNTPDKNGNFALWQGGMEPNIPVGSEKGVTEAMRRAVAGAEREQGAGASGKWVAHWKMVHIVRPVWEKHEAKNQLGRAFPALGYEQADADALVQLEGGPRTVRGARDLLSVALQYGNAFGRGFQAAALKPADFFGNDDVLYLMEDAATGEIRVSILWEWLHKGATLTEDDAATGVKKGDVFTVELYTKLLGEEMAKLEAAGTKDVHDDSKKTTLPVAKEIVDTYVRSADKTPWYIDLLNLNLENTDLATAKKRIADYFGALVKEHRRITANVDFDAAQH